MTKKFLNLHFSFSYKICLIFQLACLCYAVPVFSDEETFNKGMPEEIKADTDKACDMKEVLTTSTKDEKSSAPDKTSDETLSSLEEIFSILRKQSPALSEIITRKKDAVISGALASLDLGISIERNAGKAQETSNSSPEYFSPVVISSQKVLYVRIDGFSSANFANLREDLQAIMRLKNKPAGAVVDIRNCSGGSFEDAFELLSIFSSNLPPIGYIAGTSRPEQIVKGMPIIILLGRGSSGACEIFASFMKVSGHSILLGEDSSGRPFPFVEIPLKDGKILRIPSIPENLSNFEYSKIEPNIKMPFNNPVSYEKISEECGAEHEDAVLLRACEFLICMDGLKKIFKKTRK
ncbi:MAG: S41 family peptidase [Candidatus Nanoarchaeia archaeon]